MGARGTRAPRLAAAPGAGTPWKARAWLLLALGLGACAAPAAGPTPGPDAGPAVDPDAATDPAAEVPAPDPYGVPGSPASGPRLGDEIVVCGRRFHTGTRVVLWDDPGGYDATSRSLHFGPAPEGTETPRDGERRYHPGRRVDGGAPGEYRVPPDSRDLAELQAAVDLFVVHYDVCGTSRQCFKVLHDRRGLSVHFLLDADGTVYQTLDLRERAWHAGHVNSRSVGVEIAQIGSRALSDERGLATLEAWYPRDAHGPYLQLPAWLGDGGLAPRDEPLRPARDARVDGPIQGHLRGQYDFTPEQYDALVDLTATLCTVLPRIRPEAPRDADGAVVDRVLDDAAEAAFSGIVGHYHVSAAKQDPGPAFDWEPYLARVRAVLSAARP